MKNSIFAHSMHEKICELAVHNGLLLFPYETPIVIV